VNGEEVIEMCDELNKTSAEVEEDGEEGTSQESESEEEE
jgi:hypothetical protein